ncbi:MAG: L,D-transpeptidase family protein [Gammaproteobacteria bacterium]|nr:L,D-transpeptidase family protein [Gammaproteobacteria bacterium]
MRVSVLFLALLVSSPAASQTQVGSNDSIQYLSEQLLLGSEVRVADAALAASNIIPEFYSRREFTPAWADADQIDEFVGLIGRAYEEGLNPNDYLHVELSSLVHDYRQNPDDADLKGKLDVLLTESLSRYGNHLIYGKVDPAQLDENWNWLRSSDGQDPVALVQQAIDSDSITAFINNFLDRGSLYQRMKAMLAEYRSLKDTGGWPLIDTGPTLKLGMEDDRIMVIRKRLAVTGDLPGSEDNQSRMFDKALEQGVTAFQDRHNLDADGAIGARTLAAMNVTVDERIDQIRVNLERLRWVVRDIEDEFVVTNIASFQTFLVRNREVIWTGRSQVGRFYRQTPVFKAKIKYLQFNPTWTVPPGILRNDILPAVQKDVGYLAAKEMDLIDRDGKIVDPATVDWSRYGAGRLPPYQFVQRPGPANALGRVKFIFPNSHFVFLHDTPSKALFDRTERTFSSGCIRVENPFVFAELLLNNPGKWNSDSIQKLLDNEKPQNVFLDEPLTVMLLYGTVGLSDMRLVRFYGDIYQRDARVLDSLNAAFEVRDTLVGFTGEFH